jgi:hypothetical protein
VGSKYVYTCKRCEYSAMVSGGWDVGFIAIQATMRCEDCSELFDVGIGFTPGASAEQVEQAPRDVGVSGLQGRSHRGVVRRLSVSEVWWRDGQKRRGRNPVGLILAGHAAPMPCGPRRESAI